MALLPEKSLISLSIPLISSFLTILVLPYIAAKCRALTPLSVSLAFRLDPQVMRKLTAFRAPEYDAQCKGVLPLLSTTLTSVPLRM